VKRRGCTRCRLMEPAPGQWVGGLCPSCTQLRARQTAARPPTSGPTKDVALDATVARLQVYLARIAEQYPDVWKNVDRLRAGRGRTLPQWPSWCFMPLAGAYAIASGGRDDAPPERLGAIAALGALTAWRPTQGIYRFDPTVAAAVWDTPLDGDIPSDVLHHLPEWCVYIETPGSTYLEADSPGFFAWLEYDANDRREELRLAIDCGGTLSTAIPVHLGADLVAGVARALAEAARQAATYDMGPAQREILSIPPEMMAAAIAPRINLVLYLCSTNAEMLERNTGRLRPSKPTLTRTKDGLRMFAAEKPTSWEVAYRLGAAIRHAQEMPARRPGDGTHASPRPHVRRAHWHAFWTGPKAKPGVKGDRNLILKWLPPMAVAVGEEAEVIPTIHMVNQ
jgi:hypothetical protein